MEHTNTIYKFPKAYFCHIDNGVETVILRRAAFVWTWYGSTPSGYQYNLSQSSAYASAGNGDTFCKFLQNNNGTKIPRPECIFFYCPTQTFFPNNPNTNEDFDQRNPYDNLGWRDWLSDNCVNVYNCYQIYGASGYRLYFDDKDKSFWMDVAFTQSTNSLGEYYYRINFALGTTRSGVNNIKADVYCGRRFIERRADYGYGLRYQCQNYLSGIPFFGSYLGSDRNDVFSYYFAEYQFYTINWNRTTADHDAVISSHSWNYLSGYGDSWWGIGGDIQNIWIGDFVPVEPDYDNPYDNGGTSGEGGGDGNFSEDSDDVDDGDLADLNAIDTGFATIFTPSKSQLKSLAGVMWNDNVFAALQNLVENISGMFTSLGIVPFEVTAGRTVEVTWFGLALTEIYLTLASEQYYEFDMGTIDLSNDSRIFTSGSALDYSPFSKLGIFLPFIGYQELDIDECRESTINLKYRIDILSGTCVALVSVGGNAIYQFSGNCLTQIPITNESMQSLVSDAVQVGIAAASTHSAKGAVGAAESALSEAESAGASTKQAESQLAHAKAHLASTKSGLASATANASIGMKPTYGKTGAVSAAASLLSVRQPYLFLTTPRQSIPDHYQRFCGFPSNISGKLNTFSGFTVIEDIRLNGLVATSPEVAEIYDLLKRGVII